MAKIKGDIEIGRRMAEELLRVFGSPTKAMKGLKSTKRLLYEWQDGKTPGGLYLARLHYCKGDVIYVLTGNRRAEDGQ